MINILRLESASGKIYVRHFPTKLRGLQAVDSFWCNFKKNSKFILLGGKLPKTFKKKSKNTDLYFGSSYRDPYIYIYI